MRGSIIYKREVSNTIKDNLKVHRSITGAWALVETGILEFWFCHTTDG